MPRLLLTALVLLVVQPAPSLTLEIRAFDGPHDVTPETRVTVHRAGDRGQPLGRTAGGQPPLFTVTQGIYDVQVVLERSGRVVNIRWAERLAVMPYPDEAGHHLQVINFRHGYGALQIRSPVGGGQSFTLYPAGARSRPESPAPVHGRGYTLFVLPAGSYDLQVTRDGGVTWHTDIEVPRDRTRFWVAR